VNILAFGSYDQRGVDLIYNYSKLGLLAICWQGKGWGERRFRVVNISELKQKHAIDAVIARDTTLKAMGAGVLRGHHCDKHDNEQELTVWVNHGDDGYFWCNRCGLKGDVIDWVGYKLFNRHYDRSKTQLEQIARALGEIAVVPNKVQTKTKSSGRVLSAVDIARANWQLLYDLDCQGHRQYLASRGLHSDAAKKWLLGAYRSEVVIPIAEAGAIKAVVKRRIDRKEYHLLGTAAVLFNGDILPCEQVVLCEGAFDAILEMAVYGVPAVAMVGGVRSFPERYFSKLSDCGLVWIAMDSDAVGETVAREMGAALPNSARFELDNYHDVTDFMLALI